MISRLANQDTSAPKKLPALASYLSARTDHPAGCRLAGLCPPRASRHSPPATPQAANHHDRCRYATRSRSPPDHRCRSARRRGESDRGAWRRCRAFGLPGRWCPMGSPGALSLVAGRRDRGWPRDWICRRCHGSRLSRFATSARLFKPDTGLLGRLSIVARPSGGPS
jgi:hypothetical protein